MEPKRYVKKPVVIEAVQYDGSLECAMKIGHWMGREEVSQDWDRGMEIPTLEGTMTASPGDWIIKGIQSEFYPCRADIFEATYEEVVG